MEDAPHNLVADVMLGGVVLLGAALIAVLIFRRLGLGAVLGYLVAGIAIGPDGLGLIGAPETILAYSEIGIILLLFLVGLELSPSRLWLLRRDILLFGPLQVTLCGLGMFAIIRFAMPTFSWEAALVLGLPLALSSTAQVLPLLQSRGRMKTDYGEKSFSILLFQDISIVPLLTIVAALSRAPADEGAITGWRLVLYAVLAILGLVLAGAICCRHCCGLSARFPNANSSLSQGCSRFASARLSCSRLAYRLRWGRLLQGLCSQSRRIGMSLRPISIRFGRSCWACFSLRSACCWMSMSFSRSRYLWRGWRWRWSQSKSPSSLRLAGSLD